MADNQQLPVVEENAATWASDLQQHLDGILVSHSTEPGLVDNVPKPATSEAEADAAEADGEADHPAPASLVSEPLGVPEPFDAPGYIYEYIRQMAIEAATERGQRTRQDSVIQHESDAKDETVCHVTVPEADHHHQHFSSLMPSSSHADLPPRPFGPFANPLKKSNSPHLTLPRLRNNGNAIFERAYDRQIPRTCLPNEDCYRHHTLPQCRNGSRESSASPVRASRSPSVAREDPPWLAEFRKQFIDVEYEGDDEKEDQKKRGKKSGKKKTGGNEEKKEDQKKDEEEGEKEEDK